MRYILLLLFIAAACGPINHNHKVSGKATVEHKINMEDVAGFFDEYICDNDPECTYDLVEEFKKGRFVPLPMWEDHCDAY